MPSLEMKGPYELNRETIDRVITSVTPGNYAIGYRKDSGGFVVRYVGRADADINEELKQQPADDGTWFKWSPADSMKSAYDKHCRNFHEFGEDMGLENEEHPEPPNGTNWRCVFCGA